MKTTINIKELVNAFRAQEAERAEQERQIQLKNQERRDAISLRCRMAAEDFLPSLREVVSLLPGASEVTLVQQRNVFVMQFESQLINAGGFNTWQGTLSQEVSVYHQADGDKIIFYFGPGLKGGILPDHHPLRNYMHVENPADILITIANWAGICQATQDLEWLK